MLFKYVYIFSWATSCYCTWCDVTVQLFPYTPSSGWWCRYFFIPAPCLFYSYRRLSQFLCTRCSTKIKRLEIFWSPEPEVTWCTVTIIIRVVLLSPYLCIRGVSLSPIHYSQSRTVCINRRHQYSCFIWSENMKHSGNGRAPPSFRLCSKVQHKITNIRPSLPLISLLLNIYISFHNCNHQLGHYDT